MAKDPINSHDLDRNQTEIQNDDTKLGGLVDGKQIGILKNFEDLPKGINLEGWKPKPEIKTASYAKESGSFISYGREYIYNLGDIIVRKTDKEGEIKKDDRGNPIPSYSISKNIFEKNYKINEDNGGLLHVYKISRQPGILVSDISEKTLNFFEKYVDPKRVKMIKDKRESHGKEYKGLFIHEDGKLRVATEESYHEISGNYVLFFTYNNETGYFEDFYPMSTQEKFEKTYYTD